MGGRVVGNEQYLRVEGGLGWRNSWLEWGDGEKAGKALGRKKGVCAIRGGLEGRK